MIRFAILIIIITSLSSACICIKKDIISNKTLLIEDIAKERFIEKYKIIYNKTNEFVLVTKSHKEVTQSIPDLVFIILSTQTHKTIFEDTLKAGDVYWLNNFAIRATEREQKAESPRRMYTYDVQLKEYILN